MRHQNAIINNTTYKSVWRACFDGWPVVLVPGAELLQTVLVHKNDNDYGILECDAV
jgi:hypothetical protein